MQLRRWISLCAITGGVGVILSNEILGGESFAALTGGNTDLLVMGGGVVLVGILTLIFSSFEEQMAQRKEPSG